MPAARGQGPPAFGWKTKFFSNLRETVTPAVDPIVDTVDLDRRVVTEGDHFAFVLTPVLDIDGCFLLGPDNGDMRGPARFHDGEGLGNQGPVEVR